MPPACAPADLSGRSAPEALMFYSSSFNCLFVLPLLLVPKGCAVPQLQVARHTGGLQGEGSRACCSFVPVRSWVDLVSKELHAL